jgi:hypothetical protein
MPHLPTTFVRQFKSQGLFGSAGQAYALAFSADGRLLALGGLSRTVNLWDAYEA